MRRCRKRDHIKQVQGRANDEIVDPIGAFERTIYFIEMKPEHLKYVEAAKHAMGVTNVSTVETDGRSVGLAGIQTKVHAIFLCSLYHNMYTISKQPERDRFVDGIKESSE